MRGKSFENFTDVVTSQTFMPVKYLTSVQIFFEVANLCTFVQALIVLCVDNGVVQVLQV